MAKVLRLTGVPSHSSMGPVAIQQLLRELEGMDTDTGSTFARDLLYFYFITMDKFKGTSVKIAPLDETNYDNWKFRMETLLTARKLFGYASGGIQLSAEANDAQRNEFKGKDDEARAIISIHVSDNQLVHVRNSCVQRPIGEMELSWEKVKGLILTVADRAKIAGEGESFDNALTTRRIKNWKSKSDEADDKAEVDNHNLQDLEPVGDSETLRRSERERRNQKPIW
eukprot:gene982-10754_t